MLIPTTGYLYQKTRYNEQVRHLDLFSGIGGFALAAETVWGKQYDNVGFCDNEPFSQAIIKKHWPNATIYGDIKELAPPPADLVTGGFPCQPFSLAGKRRGTQDDRHLWPEMLRVIRASSPRWVIGENVGGLLTWDAGLVLEQVLTDLESAGYQVWPFILPAAAVGAPHRRDRIWIIANRAGIGGGERRTERARSRVSDRGESDGSNKHTSDASSPRLQRGGKSGQGQHGLLDRERGDQRANWQQDWTEIATRLCSLDDGLPNGLARPRGWRNAALKGAGNAIVPQVAIEIMQLIRAADPTML